MSLDEIRSRGREEAAGLAELTDLTAAEEQLRADLAAFWAKVPEPPAYRRGDEPLKQRAQGLLEDASPLVARGEQLSASTAVRPWLDAFFAHLEMLSLLADGQVEAADEVWRRALKLEREAARSHRLWASSEESGVSVYDRETGASRYDPQPDVTYAVRLLCPTCRAAGDYRFSPRHATHQFVCQSCSSKLTAYVAELRALEVERRGKVHHYRFRVEELSGAATRIDFDDGGATALAVARRDLVAFLYAPGRELKAVLNLTSSRVLWTSPPGGCFLATAVYGEDAPQLNTFRAFRDRALLPTRTGRLLVRGYYAVGPSLARAVVRSEVATRATRAALDVVHRRLEGAR